MQDANTVVFVEVRYRASDRWGGAAASITAKKQRRLVNAASSYLQRHPEFKGAPCRFDVVAVSGSQAEPRFKWIRSAFGVA